MKFETKNNSNNNNKTDKTNISNDTVTIMTE